MAVRKLIAKDLMANTGDKIAKKLTMDDVARLANVSKVTVSRALSGHKSVANETRDHVIMIAREHGYAVNRNAQKLRERHTSTAAVILDFSSHRRSRISDPFIFELLAGVSEALTRRKQDLLLSPAGLKSEDDYIDYVRSRAVDGFIFLGQGDQHALLRKLAAAKLPFVVWGSGSPDVQYCTVGSDNYRGGQLSGRRFIAEKRTRVLFIGDTKHMEICQRWDGLCSVLGNTSTPIFVSRLESRGFAFQESQESLLIHLDENPHPDAIFAYSDTAAMAAVSAMATHGYNAGKDYSLIGYNDILQAGYSTPPLTTIKQDTFLAGSLLVEKYMQMIQGEPVESSTIPTELIIRET